MSRNSKRFAARWHGIGRRTAILLLSSLVIIIPPSAAFAQDATVTRPASDQRFAASIAEASQRFRIPENWIHAVLDAESAHDMGAVSSAGARGLMQIMPDTWVELRALHRLGDDPFDPRDNILAGTAYLRQMLDRYGNVGAMLAAYNAGPGRYDEYLATGRPLPAETRAYVAKLAPLLGGNPLAEATESSTSRPTDWREAPLFVGPSGGSSPPGPLQSGGQSTAEGKAEPAPHGDAPMLPPEGIFVARSSEGSSI
ncbi:MAG: lytic transglycosylase domain-containing protein [Devosia sp.]